MEETGRVRLNWVTSEHGKLSVVIDGEELSWDLNKIHEKLHKKVFWHGAKQLLGDTLAGLGKGATSGDKVKALNEKFQSLVDGDWSQRSGEGNAALTAMFMLIQKIVHKDKEIMAQKAMLKMLGILMTSDFKKAKKVMIDQGLLKDESLKKLEDFIKD